jgi:hypothetical protein
MLRNAADDKEKGEVSLLEPPCVITLDEMAYLVGNSRDHPSC